MTPSPPLLERVEVDVDQVVRVAAGQAAHEQHLEVLDAPAPASRRGPRRPPRRAPRPGVQVGHQGQQPGDLVAWRRRPPLLTRGSRRPTAGRAASTTCSRSSSGASTTTSAPCARTRRRGPGRRASSTIRSQAVVSSGPGDTGSTRVGVATQRVPGAGADQERGAARRPGAGRAGARPRGRRCRAGRRTRRAAPTVRALALDPGEPEHPLLAAVEVVADDVPATGVADDAPRLECRVGGLGRAGRW